jgi:hypothetical protein
MLRPLSGLWSEEESFETPKMMVDRETKKREEISLILTASMHQAGDIFFHFIRFTPLEVPATAGNHRYEC